MQLNGPQISTLSSFELKDFCFNYTTKHFVNQSKFLLVQYFTSKLSSSSHIRYVLCYYHNFHILVEFEVLGHMQLLNIQTFIVIYTCFSF